MSWAEKKPHTPAERRKLLETCGKDAFLLPNSLKFPICNKIETSKTKCTYNCKGLKAASSRAGEWKYKNVLSFSKKLTDKLGCYKSSPSKYTFRLQTVKEINGRKRYKAFFSDGTSTMFGQTNPLHGTFLDHHDKSLKERYLRRHEKDLQTKDPKRAGYLSMFLLWNQSSLEKSIRDYNRRLEHGKFSVPLV